MTKETDIQPNEPKIPDLHNRSELVTLIRDSEESDIKIQIAQHILKLIKQYEVDNYRTIFLYDNYNSIASYHSNRIYNAVSDLNNNKDIHMILFSDGGKIEPAYLISRSCKRLTKERFVVTVPRRAKSAATLIALGANEIHMGLLSELGPIDPQFGGFPALGLANALEKIAELASKFPNSSEMFARYITANLNIRDLGYFQRINESAAQYAERLLTGKILPENRTAESLAIHFTNHYKDHGFVIDADEAADLLGSMVVEGKKEYEFGNETYKFLEFTDLILRVFRNKRLTYVGSVEDGIDLEDKPEP